MSDFFYGEQANLFSFYRFPKALFTSRRLEDVSVEAKVLYGFLLDRMGLSVKNGWKDEEGRAHIVFTVESVARFGLLTLLVVRPRQEGGYQIISGYRRQCAALLAGLKTLPVIVRELDDDQAILQMVESNLQQETIRLSERAFAYKMKLEALKYQGAQTDLTLSPSWDEVALG